MTENVEKDKEQRRSKKKNTRSPSSLNFLGLRHMMVASILLCVSVYKQSAFSL